jgi:hypothetical protein
MKRSTYFLLFIAACTILSCNRGRDSSEQTDNLTSSDLPEQCYRAIFEKDTADLRIKTAEGGNVTGHLVIDFGELKPNSLEKVVNDGKVKGKFHGDTLFVTYTYTSGSINKTVYTNPLAFLKKDGILFLGVGDVKSAMGRTYFVKDKPINFDIGRFKFEPVGCK